jgi:hypothetical protein
MTKIDRQKEVIKRVQALDKLDPFVVMTIRGVDYKLEFDNKAIRQIQTEFDVNLLEMPYLPDELFKDLDKFTRVLEIALARNHPEFDPLKPQPVDGPVGAGSLIGLKHQAYIIHCLRDAADFYFPDVSDLPPGESKSADGDPPE